jgi:hypothetical protein
MVRAMAMASGKASGIWGAGFVKALMGLPHQSRIRVEDQVRVGVWTEVT